MRVWAGIRKILRDDSGQALTEYILLLTFTVMLSTALIRAIMQALDKAVLVLGGQLEKDLKSGRTGLSVWKN